MSSRGGTFPGGSKGREGAGPEGGGDSALLTGFYLHPAAALHDTGWDHPEHQGRLRTLASTVGKDLLALFGRVEQFEAREADLDELLRVHPAAHLERLRETVERAQAEGRVVEFAPETPVSDASWEAVMGSAGALLDAVERVADGRLRNAFVAARPPGHHAGADYAMGFCPVNHVAVAARYLQATGRARRVAIVDWDVHHGNGTQDIFYHDPDVYFLSLHQAPFYPGTGGAEERGAGSGEGTTLNVPLPAGTDGTGYQRAFDAALTRVEEVFAPDFILVSAGYDALAGDPLGGMLLEPEDFHSLTERVMAWGERVCGGRVVCTLEGGYEPKRTGLAVVATVRALAGVGYP